MKVSNTETTPWSKWLVLGALLIAVTVLTWFHRQQNEAHRAINQTGNPPIKTDFSITQPLPDDVEQNSEKVALGERLFHDVRLSSNNTISCLSCHDLTMGAADHRAHSIGVNGAIGDINAPTIFNSGFNFVQFWDGRAESLEEQIEGPLNNPKEMASNWPQVLNKLAKDQTYPAQFLKLYDDGIKIANIKEAIATFERSLVTPNSRFDQFLRGNPKALSAQEKQGFELFQSYGCSSCHQGINLGGNMFEKMGLMGDYFAKRGNPTKADNGRFNVDHKEHSRHEFKVPSLRNIALTAPYFHDGSAQTLQQAVSVMIEFQLGRVIPTADEKAICAFLESLTGEYKGKPL